MPLLLSLCAPSLPTALTPSAGRTKHKEGIRGEELCISNLGIDIGEKYMEVGDNCKWATPHCQETYEGSPLLTECSKKYTYLNQQKLLINR